MKGIVFNAAEQVVVDEFGEDAWEAILADTGLTGAYTSLGTYPDSDLSAIVVAASDRLGIPVDDVLRFVGRHGLAYLSDRHPQYLQAHDSPTSFLHSLNSVVHPEIRKIMPEASPPDFRAMDADRGSLLLEYRSQRGLCMLAEGFALGVGDHYGYDFDVRQSTCTHRGDPFCTLHITWTADDG